MRNRPVSLRFLPLLVLCLLAAPAHAIEFGLVGDFSNLQIPWTTLSPMTGSFSSNNFFEGGSAWITAPLGEDASIKVAYDRDPVLRNSASAAVQFERGLASISVGPYVGFLNSSSESWSAGMAASLRLQWPGVAYVSFSNLGGLAVSLLPIAGDPQAMTELSAGIYVPHAIIAGVVSSKRFNETDSAGNLVSDSLTRYALTVDVFKKDVPYTALFSLGYENRTKYFASSDTTDALGAIVLGVDSTVQLGRPIKLLADFSTGAYVYGLNALQGLGPPSSAFLFSASLGVDVDLAAVSAAPPKKAAAKAEETPSETENAASGEGTGQGGAQATSPGADQAAKSGKEGEAPSAAAAAPEAVPEAGGKPKKNGPGFDAGLGLCYDAMPLTGSTLDWLLAMFYSRGGFWGDLMVPLKGGLSGGAELGLYYMTVSIGGTDFNLVDLPLLAKLAYSVGKVKLEGLAGLYAMGSFSGSASPVMMAGIDGGLRLYLGGLYAEGSYVFGLGSMPSFPRYGLGYSLKIK
jgi:hypothetical protein